MMCRQRVLFPEGKNNGYAKAAVVDGRYSILYKKNTMKTDASVVLHTSFPKAWNRSMWTAHVRRYHGLPWAL